MDKSDKSEGRVEDLVEDAMDAVSPPEDATLSPMFGSSVSILQRYTHCDDCGGRLHFTQITDFSRNITQESARCPECGFQARQGMHKLQ